MIYKKKKQEDVVSFVLENTKVTMKEVASNFDIAKLSVSNIL